MPKLVSVIITCFNQKNYITEAIMSAVNQTYRNIEIVFIDDCSSDASLQIANNLKKQYSNIVILKNDENRGVVYSRNRAIDAAKGFYIMPLDGDDTIEPTYIEKAVNIIENNTDIGFVYCKARKFGAINDYWNLPEFNKENFIFGNCIVNSTLYKKSDFIKVGKYKEYMHKWTEDYDLYLSFVEIGLIPYRIDEVLYNHREFEHCQRTDITAKDPYYARREYLLHHTKLYADSRECINRIFDPHYKAYKNNYFKHEKSLKKYKTISFFEGLFILVMLMAVFIYYLV